MGSNELTIADNRVCLNESRLFRFASAAFCGMMPRWIVVGRYKVLKLKDCKGESHSDKRTGR